VIYRLDGIDNTIAKKVSHMMDQDRGIDSGSKGWKKGGQVKRYNGNHSSILLFCLATAKIPWHRVRHYANRRSTFMTNARTSTSTNDLSRRGCSMNVSSTWR